MVGLTLKTFSMNLALLSKQAWHIHQNCILKGIYFPSCDLWETRNKRGSFWAWASLMQGRDFIAKHKAWIIGHGTSINVWCDKCLQMVTRYGAQMAILWI